ncbi:hypothetical protein O6P43_033014 [Quillaja saponaria]|uniref:Uncharacterized protein n=1 Tax=Quillaja saponaria TaxID=32244 RepID=A0AAD7KPV2_QUISA|nr:hypothetical protein O6P43_033014 [Quillaja saponaria]
MESVDMKECIVHQQTDMQCQDVGYQERGRTGERQSQYAEELERLKAHGYYHQETQLDGEQVTEEAPDEGLGTDLIDQVTQENISNASTRDQECAMGCL